MIGSQHNLWYYTESNSWSFSNVLSTDADVAGVLWYQYDVWVRCAVAGDYYCGMARVLVLLVVVIHEDDDELEWENLIC